LLDKLLNLTTHEMKNDYCYFYVFRTHIIDFFTDNSLLKLPKQFNRQIICRLKDHDIY
jgi:hypothetical protein